MPGPTIGALWGSPPSHADQPFVPLLPLDYVAAGTVTGVQDVEQGVSDAGSAIADAAANAASQAISATLSAMAPYALAVAVVFIALDLRRAR